MKVKQRHMDPPRLTLYATQCQRKQQPTLEGLGRQSLGSLADFMCEWARHNHKERVQAAYNFIKTRILLFSAGKTNKQTYQSIF